MLFLPYSWAHGTWQYDACQQRHIATGSYASWKGRSRCGRAARAAETAETHRARTTANWQTVTGLSEGCRKVAASVAAGGMESPPGGTSRGGYQAPSTEEEVSVGDYVDACDSPGDIYLQLLQVGLPCICPTHTPPFNLSHMGIFAARRKGMAML